MRPTPPPANPPGLLADTRVVMVHPFFPENVGAAARAMKNCGLSELVLVEGCPPDHPNAVKMAVGSEEILEQARVVDTLEAALEGVTLAFGTTSHGYENQRPLFPREAAALASAEAGNKGKIALVFGNEKNGLKKREIALCHQSLRIPSAVEGASLNLAQAIMICAYEWQLATQPEDSLPLSSLAAPDDLQRIESGLEALLERAGFFKEHQATRNRAILARILTRLRVDRDEAEILKSAIRRLRWSADQPL